MSHERQDKGAQTGVAADGKGCGLLFELRGERPGRIVPLDAERFRIGSAKGNNLILNERGVAAHQLEIVRTGVRWKLLRTDPGGAAFLNGEPVQEGLLERGSILTVGETTLRFVAPGETVSQEELWAPVGGRQETGERGPRSAVKWGGLALLVLLGAGAVWAVLSQRSPSPDTERSGGASGKPTAEDIAVDPKVLRPLYDRGKDLLAARRWDEAVVVFAGIRDVAPSFLDTESAYQEALRESANLDLLNHGKGLLTEGEIGEARRVLKSIDKQSVYYREMERLIREIEGSSRQVRLRLVEEALARGEWEVARLEAEAILAKEPDNQSARRLLEEARKKGQGSEGNRAAAGNTGGQQPAKRVDERRSDTRKVAPSGTDETTRSMSSGSAVERAIELYWKGDAEGAIRTLEHASRIGADGGRSSSTEAVRKIDEIRDASRLFEQASSLDAEGRTVEAVKAWESFLSKDREVSGGRNRGALFDRASNRLGRLCYERGKRAFDREDFPGAFFFWHMAWAMAPGNRDVQAGRAKLDEMAQEIYREGYALQEMNPREAIKRWKRVLGMVPPDHSYYSKAKERIEILSGIP